MMLMMMMRQSLIEASGKAKVSIEQEEY